MIKKFTFLIAALLITFQIKAQLITSKPPFPTANDSVTIIFNAALGDQGLKGYTGDVYAHTGVITNLSTSYSDWRHVVTPWDTNLPKTKMKNIGTNLWELKISPSIRAYYNVPTSEKILKLAFVFRNADGSITGRNVGGADIFYDVYQPGLNVQITNPTKTNPNIISLNDSVQINWNSSSADSTFLFIDNKLIKADTGTTFSLKIKGTTTGKHWIVAKADSASKIVYDSAYFFVLGANTFASLPQGIRDGINYINDSTVTLCLYAPQKKYVFVIGDFNNWEVGNQWQMKETPDSLRYWLTISGLKPKKQYVFQYFIDGSIRIGDPYASQVSDPWNDKYISSATYPNLIPYPYGKTTGIATVLETGQTPYSWKVKNFTPPKKEDLVVYELWVSDFTKAHTFDAIIDTLDYLKKLGVNAIELMPVNEFEGNLSWGYNPNYYFAVDKYYGPRNTYKAFIDTCHANGIAVIMDVVLNHAMGTCPLAMMYWNASKNQPAANNPWFNETSPNPVYSWGNDFNYDSPQTMKFADSVTNYWLTEYKVDGFRFDFAKGFTNTPGDGYAYDQSRINHLEHIYNHMKSFHPNAIDILELFTAQSEEKVLTDYGMTVWGNENYNYGQATMGYSSGSDFSGISYKQNGFSKPGSLMGYMESHDEERLMYKNETYGNSNSSGSYNVKDTITGLKRMEMAGAFFFTVPGPKMIWMFGELGYDYSINYCSNGTINNNCRTDLKPIRWDYYNQPARKKLYEVWSALIKLKKTQPVFKTANFTMDVSSLIKKIQLNDNSMDVTIIGNFDVNPGSINPTFQKAGWWYDYFTGDSLNVTNTNSNISLQPGEYHLYTSKKLLRPDFVTGVSKIVNPDNFSKINIFPNPSSANSMAEMKVKLSSPVKSSRIIIYDLTGRKVKTVYQGSLKKGQNMINLDLNGIGQGLYIVTVQTLNRRIVSKLIVN